MNEKMSEQEFMPFGVEVYVSNLERALKFYTEVLRFEVMRLNEAKTFASLDFHDSVFMLEQKPDLVQPSKGIVIRFMVPNVESYYQELLDKGVVMLKPLEKMSYGATRFYIKDPDGYQLKFAGK